MKNAHNAEKYIFDSEGAIQTQRNCTSGNFQSRQQWDISYLHCLLTLKAQITTGADDIHKYFFHCFSEKIRLDVSSEYSASQVLFSSKDKSKKNKISSAAIFVWRFKGLT